ncbi:hypothetical protein Q1W73_12770 [Asticcacaulis sp. ZE23SCel15]|uniref:hypothetical protein n=1 Tax=Asticcacaulis sp. ZE23SCel15 TaxID=3059027 RepID=UPI00265F9C1E|nr:hypothetical protein [Asticcacaulis sp. ZE23SCel15]WKL56553.1 hypothetical protein Q1W73_12770 [Asticcacaulis sp. ZE23SCel15]
MMKSKASTEELYKSLRTESASFHEKIQSLWLQKMTLIGGVLAFILTYPKEVEASRFGDLETVGLILIPTIALVLDLKLLEYSLHVRTISAYIAKNFSSFGLAAKWERELWSGGRDDVRWMTRARSALTILSAAIPTVGLFVVSAFLCAHKNANQELFASNVDERWLWATVLFVTLLYTGATAFSVKTIFLRTDSKRRFE